MADKKDYNCEICSTVYSSTSALKRHITDKHKGQFFYCSLCPHKTHRQHDLIKHVQKIHPDPDEELTIIGKRQPTNPAVPPSPAKKAKRSPRLNSPIPPRPDGCVDTITNRQRKSHCTTTKKSSPRKNSTIAKATTAPVETTKTETDDECEEEEEHLNNSGKQTRKERLSGLTLSTTPGTPVLDEESEGPSTSKSHAIKSKEFVTTSDDSSDNEEEEDTDDLARVVTHLPATDTTTSKEKKKKIHKASVRLPTNNRRRRQRTTIINNRTELVIPSGTTCKIQ